MDVENSTEVVAAPAEQDFKLAPAAIDWTTNKTQVTVGVALAVATGAAITSGSQAVPAFVVLSGAILTALITAEIAGAHGSRLGGAPAVWAGILFALAPWSRLTDTSAGAGLLPQWLCVPLYLLAMFSFLRFRNTQERGHLRLALLASAAVLFTRVEAATLPFAILAAELLLPIREPTGRKTRKLQSWIAVALFFLVLSFIGTAGRLAPGMVPMLRAEGFAPIQEWFAIDNLRRLLAGNPIERFGYGLVILGAGFFGSIRVAGFAAAWIAIASANLAIAAAPLAILLSCGGLPVTNAVPRRTARITTIVGLVALTMIAVSWFLTKP